MRDLGRQAEPGPGDLQCRDCAEVIGLLATETDLDILRRKKEFSESIKCSSQSQREG